MRPSQQGAIAEARYRTREMLKCSTVFSCSSPSVQQNLYEVLLSAQLAEAAGDATAGHQRDRPELAESIDFPEFVADLVKGVFQANVEATLQQMQAYAELLEDATKSVSDFVDAIDDTTALEYLAEASDDKFGHDEARDTASRLAAAKAALAKARRALLRETVLMDVARLAAERGQDSRDACDGELAETRGAAEDLALIRAHHRRWRE